MAEAGISELERYSASSNSVSIETSRARRHAWKSLETDVADTDCQGIASKRASSSWCEIGGKELPYTC